MDKKSRSANQLENHKTKKECQNVFSGNPAILSFDINEVLQLLQVSVIKNEMPGLYIPSSEPDDESGAGCPCGVFELTYDAQASDAYLLLVSKKTPKQKIKPIQLTLNYPGKRNPLKKLDRFSHYENGTNCGFVFEIPVSEVAVIALGNYRYFVTEIYDKAVRFYGAGVPGQ